MATFTIEPEQRTLHGVFSRELEPVLTIDSGDTVIYRTLDSGWHLEPRTSTNIDAPVRKFEPRNREHGGGHALCGPVAIRGAEPGMTLAVQIKDVRPGAWGHTFAGGWHSPLNERLGLDKQGTILLWTLDADQMTARNQHGHTVSLRPFMGVMGMPPAEPGFHGTPPPRVTGGNIDCKELVAGSTLYLPIAVPGGLFSVGDGHGVQGDGEVCVTAIECPMERVELQFDLVPDLHLTTPRANTPAGWITFGFHTDLYEAMVIALEAMLELMQTQYQLGKPEAFGLASLVVDLRITQIVNAGMLGVHAVLPHGAIR
ncbi:MAG TPA: acetamidase/formamidase family protein [Herpetosiphonaceae bacterium]